MVPSSQTKHFWTANGMMKLNAPEQIIAGLEAPILVLKS